MHIGAAAPFVCPGGLTCFSGGALFFLCQGAIALDFPSCVLTRPACVCALCRWPYQKNKGLT